MKNKLFMVREVEEGKPTCSVKLREEAEGYTFPLHWHNYFELEFLLSGYGTHLCNGVEYEIEGGDTWLMSLCDFHSVKMKSNSTYLHIAFNKGFLTPELESLISTRGLRHRLSATEMNTVYSLCDELITESNRRAPYFEDAQRVLITRLVIQLLRSTRPESNTKPSPMICTILSYIHEHFREDLSLEKLARAYGFSQNYFGKIFRDTVGLSFRDYLNKLRLKFACELLSSTDLRIKEIAYTAGYQSVEYFLYAFKKNLSTSPGAYRKTIRA